MFSKVRVRSGLFAVVFWLQIMQTEGNIILPTTWTAKGVGFGVAGFRDLKPKPLTPFIALAH